MNTAAHQQFLTDVLAAQPGNAAGLPWLHAQLAGPLTSTALYLAFGRVPRQLGRASLELTAAQLARAGALRPGFDPGRWTVDQAARTLLLLHAAPDQPADFTALLRPLFEAADLRELTALYASLPLLPHPEAHVAQAAEGVRTAITDVFDAVALDNPYPHDYLPPAAWNQLVLKAVFNARPLHRIYGLDRRRTPALAAMLVDYAHERWAAGRAVTPELWRLVGPFLTAAHLPDVERLLASPDPLQAQAGCLALADSPLPAARALLARQPAPAAPLTWQLIGERAYAD